MYRFNENSLQQNVRFQDTYIYPDVSILFFILLHFLHNYRTLQDIPKTIWQYEEHSLLSGKHQRDEMTEDVLSSQEISGDGLAIRYGIVSLEKVSQCLGQVNMCTSSSSIHLVSDMEWNEWNFRSRFCTVRLFWDGNNPC